jgi:TetR/AcrR family transcriptional regulator
MEIMDQGKTQQKIFQAATSLFIEKGIDRTTVRDIAHKAGINIALLNYHYKSKENLFNAVLEHLIESYLPDLQLLSNASISLEERIKGYVDTYIDLLLTNPALVTFFLGVLNRDPAKTSRMPVFKSLYNREAFTLQLEEETRLGNIRPTNPSQFFVSLLSLTIFPFAARFGIMEVNNLTEEGFLRYMEARKKIVFNMLWDSIKIPK